ncbi:MAG: DUF3467 domain-containing protein [Phycisphaerales bacterium]|jgi:hypothetical protein
MEQPELNIDEFGRAFGSQEPGGEPGQAQAGARQLRIRVDERNLQTTYVNGFRSTTTPEEVVLDFGLNLVQQTGLKENPHDMVFRAESRLVMTWYNAKRLALSLGQSVQRFEQEFGPIELNAAHRRIEPQPPKS